MSEDVRDHVDPDAEVPQWFWDQVHEAQQDQHLFRAKCHAMTRDELKLFITTFDELAACFVEPPFVPPKPVRFTTNSLRETGYWVISQGKQFFMDVWKSPQQFSHLVETEVEDIERKRSYSGVAGSVWLERFPDEDIP